MRRKENLIGIVLILSILGAFYSEPAAEGESLTVNVKIGSAAKLEINKDTITFIIRHKNKITQVPAAGNDVRVHIRVRRQNTDSVYLNIMADGDLVSEAGIIPIENVIWQASGCISSGGSLSKSASVRVGAWIEGGNKQLVFRFFLKDSENYPEGEYRGTILFTLASP
jgi:hypothetical protein